MRLEASVTINAPVERVFAFISDIDRQPEWIGAVAGVSRTSSGPVQLGSTFTLSLSLMGKTADASQEVTRFEPNYAFTQTTTSGPIPTEVTILVEPSGTGSLVRNITEADISSLGRFAGPIVTRTINHQLHTDLETLREILERKSS